MNKMISIAILSFLTPWAAAKDVYIWVDEYGERHFSDQKPKNKADEELEVRNVGKKKPKPDEYGGTATGAGLPIHPEAALGVRSADNLRQTFEKYKDGLFSIYHSAQQDNPQLQGKVRFKLTISPGGRVERCEILSTGLHDDALNTALRAEVMGFDFGASAVTRTTTKWAVSFSP